MNNGLPAFLAVVLEGDHNRHLTVDALAEDVRTEVPDVMVIVVVRKRAGRCLPNNRVCPLVALPDAVGGAACALSLRLAAQVYTLRLSKTRRYVAHFPKEHSQHAQQQTPLFFTHFRIALPAAHLEAAGRLHPTYWMRQRDLEANHRDVPMRPRSILVGERCGGARLPQLAQADRYDGLRAIRHVVVVFAIRDGAPHHSFWLTLGNPQPTELNSHSLLLTSPKTEDLLFRLCDSCRYYRWQFAC